MSTPRQNYVQCPCCWKRFHLSQVLWVAKHRELKDDYFRDSEGDRTKQKRFLPERFRTDCRAIDERGEICSREFACPHCHMEIPEIYFNSKPMYVSIVGTKGSGKTFFLTALHYRLLQNRFEEDYGLKGVSYDAALYASQNRHLEANVKMLFRSLVPPDEFVTLNATEKIDHAERVFFPDTNIETETWVALPFTYILELEKRKHALCLYDCQGGFFTKQGGIGDADNIFLQHILDSDILFFIYDPTQNECCVQDYAEKYGRQIYRDGQIDKKELVGMELEILNPTIEEQSHLVFGAMANHIRNHADPKKGVMRDDRYAKYICIIVTKCDAWERCLSETTQRYLRELPRYDVITDVSKDVERWINKHDPTFTRAVKNFAKHAKHYTYVPVSAAGRQVKRKAVGEDMYREGYDIGIEPLNPRWVDVPFLCALYPPNENEERQR